MNQSTFRANESHNIDNDSISYGEQDIRFIDRTIFSFNQTIQIFCDFFADVFIPIVFFVCRRYADQMEIECLAR